MTTSNLNHVPNAADRKDILELQEKIRDFRDGKIDEERFKHYRLTRGVYGQRQYGVHMFRTKLPLGRINSAQLHRLADISEKYATGNLHLTTRQNIQFHYVKLENSTAIWEQMAQVGLNAREACGNTVRNITASAKAGIDPHELYDVSPHAWKMYEHFLRNPICQEMGRKIKIAFSSSKQDTAYTYFHDFGFIPIVRDGEKGFSVVVGGGLGAQSIVAQQAFDFLPADQIIPFTEAAVRVFDREGEREKRFKARMKFLLKKMGLEAFLALVKEEMTAVPDHTVPVDESKWQEADPPAYDPSWKQVAIPDQKAFDLWRIANTIPQKQEDYVAVGIKLRLGDIDADRARILSEIVPAYAADDIRITVNQGFMLRHVHRDALAPLYLALQEIELADAGFQSIADVTACPGTDTCNLGVTNSTGLANELENLVTLRFPELLSQKDIQIKLSGCMNSCGQHMAAQIGFHGSSLRVDGKVAPAMQVVLGGGIEPDGKTYIGEKVIKIPTKRIPETLKRILENYLENREKEELFNQYFYRVGNKHFYHLLKDLSDKESLTYDEFQDWGQNHDYIQAIGVGECAGAQVDLIATIFGDAGECLQRADEFLSRKNWAGAIYNSYRTMIIAAKALLLAEDMKCNTHRGIIEDFQEHFIEEKRLQSVDDFSATAALIKEHTPTEDFARQYFKTAASFYQEAFTYRQEQIAREGGDKEVVKDHYKA